MWLVMHAYKELKNITPYNIILYLLTNDKDTSRCNKVQSLIRNKYKKIVCSFDS